MTPTIDGIDVSHWNEMSDPAAVPALSLMACKATEGKTFISPMLETFVDVFERREARYVGVYHWIRTDSTVPEQISNLVRALGRIGWVEPSGELRRGALIQLDWEHTVKRLKDKPPVDLPDPTVEMIEQWVDGVRQKFGDRVIVYCSDWMLNFTAWRERHPDVPLWYANYDRTDGPTGGRRECAKYGATVWQWTDRAKVPGFKHGIDANQILDINTLDRLSGRTTPTPPPVVSIDPVITDDPSDDGADEGGGPNVASHRWMPKGFLNQFEMPGCLPVTPADVGARGPGRAPIDPSDPFAALPLFSEFHPQRFLAILHRNGITRQQMVDEQYFVRDPEIVLQDHERDFYRRQGVPVD
jgi:GH25 family lysozyme M1 (1,4-beta-N-acetylmuramidase)